MKIEQGLVRWRLVKPLCGEDWKSPCAVKIKEALVWWMWKIKTPLWGEGKDILVWWKIRKTSIKKIRKQKKKTKKNQKEKENQKERKKKESRKLFSVISDKLCLWIFVLSLILNNVQRGAAVDTSFCPNLLWSHSIPSSKKVKIKMI